VGSTTATPTVPWWETFLISLLPGLLVAIEGLFPNTGAKTGSAKLAAATTVSKSLLSVAHTAGKVSTSEASNTHAIQTVVNQVVAAQKAKGVI
jgi:hypothetical protein